MEQIVTYQSMADFYAALGGTLEQESEFTIHPLEEIHAAVPMKSPMFRANYYSIVLIRAGRGRYFLDDRTYETKPQTIYFNNPGHIKGFEVFQLVHGYVITCSETFLRQYIGERILDEFPFLIAEIVPPQYPELELFQSFDDLGGQILAEYRSDSTYKFKIIGHALAMLLYKIKENFWRNYNPIEDADRNSAIVTAFKHDLERHFRDLAAEQIDTIYQVRDYAATQSLHPSYFSTVIKSKTGKSVNTWIAEKTIAQAQALLARSTATVQQVSIQLGFKEAGHFSRFFKKQTGIAPSEFRRNLGL